MVDILEQIVEIRLFVLGGLGPSTDILSGRSSGRTTGGLSSLR